ncbi:MAG: hypothetical protein Q8S33_15150 [Myxococcales bacterium]|nr:hypothetical protein [Myxococcales bacterium]
MNSRFVCLVACLLVVACGPVAAPGVDGGTEPERDAGGLADSGTTMDAGVMVDAGLTPDAGLASDGGLTLAIRAAAARQTALSNPLCTAIEPFYWEIGDADGGLVSGARGTMFGADTEVPIASASKWVFGAYVVERLKADLTQLDVNALTMRAGYSSFTSCAGTTTVATCHLSGMNGVLTPANVGRFDYGGGHFQKYGVDLGIGAMTNAMLETEFQRVLGAELTLGFNSPQLAGGMNGTAAGYARLLRKILSGSLEIKAHLGENAACTLRGPSCPTALGSPGGEAMHYSYGHWVEDAPGVGDEAFSSAGAFGFYPWIDATKTLYGVVSRREISGGAGMDSLECGRQLRKAFVTGVAQP